MPCRIKIIRAWHKPARNYIQQGVNPDTQQDSISTAQPSVNQNLDREHYNNKLNELINNALGIQPASAEEMPTGFASNLKNMTPTEKAQSFLYEDLLNKSFNMSSNNTINAMHDFAAAKNNPNAKVLNNLSSVNDSRLYNVMKNKLGIPANSRGIVYYEYSKISKSLSNSPEIDKFIKNNYSKIKNNQIQTAGITFDINSQDLLFLPFNLEKVDRYGAFQHITLYNPRIDKNGYFIADGIDFYDFTRRNPNNPKNMPNNWGYSMQQKGNLENYFILVKIKRKIGK